MLNKTESQDKLALAAGRTGRFDDTARSGLLDVDHSKHVAHASVGRVRRRRVTFGMGCLGPHNVHIDWTPEAYTSGVRSRAAARSLVLAVSCAAPPTSVLKRLSRRIGALSRDRG